MKLPEMPFRCLPYLPSISPPPGYQRPIDPCECGSTNFLFTPRENGCGYFCMECGKVYAHAPKAGKILSPRGRQGDQRRLRKTLRERYGNACALCKEEGNLEVHHILPVKIAPEYKLEPNNCILLCKRHHAMITAIERKGLREYRREDDLLNAAGESR